LRTIHKGFKELQGEGLPVDAIAPEAAIYLTVKIDLKGKKKIDGQQLVQQADVTAYLLDAAGLALVPFYAFGASLQSPWYRLSVGTCKKEEIPSVIAKLREAILSLQ